MPTDPLAAQRLVTRCDPRNLDFQRTDELEELHGVVGQDRAIEAIELGLSVRRRGYNLFVLGPPGTGRHAAVRQLLARRAAQDPVPDDWCYVHNFEDARRPKLLRLPPGLGPRLRSDMQQLIEELRAALPAIFESEAYRTRRRSIEEEIEKRQADGLQRIAEDARKHGVALVRTPMGFGVAAMRGGEVVPPEEVEQLPDEEKEPIKREMEQVHQQVQEVLEKVPEWQREGRERIRELDRAAIKSTVARLVAEVRRRHQELPRVVAFLDAVEADVLEHPSAFLEHDREDQAAAMMADRSREESARRYRVNVLVHHEGADGAPVVHEGHPNLTNLIGRIEHQARWGALMTDFNLIEGGALHRANGGYLIIDARELLTQPFAWAQLKRVLRTEELRIESPSEALGLPSTISLEPEPVPFHGKVVLVGERLIYALLCQIDPDFSNLFKVAADFEERIEREPDTVRTYARLLATIACREGLRPLTRDAVARVVDHAARLAEDAGRLSTRMRSLLELMVEADHSAGRHERDAVSVDDVETAINARIRRASRVRDRVLEGMREGVLRVDVHGTHPGTVNGLSVVSLADVYFGRPARVTARAGQGRGEVVDIEREVELGGPIHSKGVLILQGYLVGQYGGDAPLALRASLVFEQSYVGVEGDSASLAELCALLSSIGHVPLRQGLAVTGAVDQHGDVQAVGAVNEKIEGFFDACAQEGLTGDQGVILPASNVRHLMLRHDVVQAAAEGRFHVYPVRTVDEAIALLTGLEPGSRGPEGAFLEGSVHSAVATRLAHWSDQLKRLQAPTASNPEA